MQIFTWHKKGGTTAVSWLRFFIYVLYVERDIVGFASARLQHYKNLDGGLSARPDVDVHGAFAGEAAAPPP